MTSLAPVILAKPARSANLPEKVKLFNEVSSSRLKKSAQYIPLSASPSVDNREVLLSFGL